MLSRFKTLLNNEFPFLKKAKLLLAISGGIDSVVLAHLLYKSNLNFELAHCNFSLRGKESDKDESFVINYANELNCKVFTQTFDTKKYAKKEQLSIQEAARNLRYNWFNQMAKENTLILTAHHLEDNIETFFINLSRGTGLDGLTGIPVQNNKVFRPLLSFTRTQIEQYAILNKLTWREDASNQETKYLRNKIRHQITPVLKEINPNITDAFQLTFNHLQNSKLLVDQQINEVLKKVQVKDVKNNCLKFNVSKLAELSPLSTYLYEIFKPYGFTNTKDLISIINAQSGKQLFSKTYRLIKNRDYLLLAKITLNNSATYSITELTKQIKIDDFKVEVNNIITNKDKMVSFDKDLLKFPLTVRKWQKGDYFYPTGLQGKKKLSKFFKDEKMSLLEKENIWLLLSNNQIIWVIGKRQDERFKITERTNNIYNLTIQHEENH